MSDDWNVGDLALCIRDKNWSPNGAGREPDQCSTIVSVLFPRVGSEWRVTNVGWHYCAVAGRDIPYLGLAGQPSDSLYDSRYFVKIAPHEPDAEDAETIYQLVYAPSPALVPDTVSIGSLITCRSAAVRPGQQRIIARQHAFYAGPRHAWHMPAANTDQLDNTSRHLSEAVHEAADSGRSQQDHG